jgi:hypothetical protein
MIQELDWIYLGMWVTSENLVTTLPNQLLRIVVTPKDVVSQRSIGITGFVASMAHHKNQTISSHQEMWFQKEYLVLQACGKQGTSQRPNHSSHQEMWFHQNWLALQACGKQSTSQRPNHVITIEVEYAHYVM